MKILIFNHEICVYVLLDANSFICEKQRRNEIRVIEDNLNKQKIIANFFEGHETELFIINPEDFFRIKQNGILDAKVIKELQSEVESVLGKSRFVIIDDEGVNACATEEDEVSIIALYAGTVKKVLCDANIMMLSDEFLVGIGNMEMCYHNISIDDYVKRMDEENDSVLKMTISEDYIRETVGYMIASLAVHFIVYHEVGHHKLNHIKKLKEKYKLSYQEALHTENSEEYIEERKQMELDADLYAADLIVEKNVSGRR